MKDTEAPPEETPQGETPTAGAWLLGGPKPPSYGTPKPPTPKRRRRKDTDNGKDN